MSIIKKCRTCVWIVCLAAGFTLSGCNTGHYAAGGMSTSNAAAPDYIVTTAKASYKPVNQPGTQRRAAQSEAEQLARRQISAAAGAMEVAPGMTVNDVIARDSKVRSEFLNYVRTTEVIDWKVDPACAEVQVWVRLDLNRVRLLVSCNR